MVAKMPHAMACGSEFRFTRYERAEGRAWKIRRGASCPSKTVHVLRRRSDGPIRRAAKCAGGRDGR